MTDKATAIKAKASIDKYLSTLSEEARRRHLEDDTTREFILQVAELYELGGWAAIEPIYNGLTEMLQKKWGGQTNE